MESDEPRNNPQAPTDLAATRERAHRREKRVRWHRRWFFRLFLVGCAVLAFAAMWINGPGVRWIARTQLEKFLSTDGISAKCRVEGTLLSGLAIHELRAVPEKGGPPPSGAIRSLRVDLASVDYDLRPLIRGDYLSLLREVRVSNVFATLDLPPSEEEEENVTKDEPGGVPDDLLDSIRSSLDRFWPLLACAYRLENINLTVRKGGQDLVTLDGFDFIMPGYAGGTIRARGVAVPPHLPQQGFAFRTEASDQRLTLEAGEPLFQSHGVSLHSMNLLRRGDSLLTAELGTVDAALGIDVSSAGEVAIGLERGSIDLEKIAARAGLEKAPSGVVSQLRLTTELVPGNPIHWPLEVALSAENLAWEKKPVGDLTLTVSGSPAQSTAALRLAAPGNASLTVDGNWTAPEAESATELAAGRGEMTLRVDVPEIVDTVPMPETVKLTGGIGGEASVTIADLRPVAGQADFGSDTLRYAGVPVAQCRLSATLPREGFADVTSTVGLSPVSSVAVRAGIDYAELERITYTAGVDFQASLEDAPVRELLTALGVKPEEADGLNSGRIAGAWQGGGAIAGSERLPAGELNLTVTELDLPNAAPASIAVTAGHQGENVAVERLEGSWGDLALSLSQAKWEERRLDVPEVAVSTAGERLATARLSVPLDLAVAKDVAGFFGQPGEALVQLDVPPLSMERLGQLIGKPDLPVKGSIRADVDFAGTLDALRGRGETGIEGLQVESDPAVPPGDLAFALSAGDGWLDLSGSFRHPQIEPLEISLRAPFQPVKWSDEGLDPRDLPLAGVLTLPSTDLGFLPDYVPAIRRIAGRISADVMLSGTAAAPRLKGGLEINISRLSSTISQVPDIKDLEVVLAFTENEVRISRFFGLAAGGQINVGGAVRLPRGPERPLSFDVKLEADEALIYRAADVNLRTDGTVTLSGPWDRARIAGDIQLTGGRFYKTFDLVPMELLFNRDTASEIPTIDRPSSVRKSQISLGTELEPFRNWEFDLAVKTEANEPFRVRTNVASGDIRADMTIRGRGERLIPSGWVKARKAFVVLPFSRVDFSEASLNFSELTLFNPAIDVRGAASVGNHTIDLYGFGLLTRPGYALSSSPPLPQSEILTLLSTGSTRSELTSGSEVALSKAALLILRDTVPKGQRADGKPTISDRINNRVAIEGVRKNPRTGELMVTGRIKVRRNVDVTASMGQDGDYRGLLRYLFRWR